MIGNMKGGGVNSEFFLFFLVNQLFSSQLKIKDFELEHFL